MTQVFLGVRIFGSGMGTCGIHKEPEEPRIITNLVLTTAKSPDSGELLFAFVFLKCIHKLLKRRRAVFMEAFLINKYIIN